MLSSPKCNVTNHGFAHITDCTQEKKNTICTIFEYSYQHVPNSLTIKIGYSD